MVHQCPADFELETLENISKPASTDVFQLFHAKHVRDVHSTMAERSRAVPKPRRAEEEGGAGGRDGGGEGGAAEEGAHRGRAEAVDGDPLPGAGHGAAEEEGLGTFLERFRAEHVALGPFEGEKHVGSMVFDVDLRCVHLAGPEKDAFELIRGARPFSRHVGGLVQTVFYYNRGYPPNILYRSQQHGRVTMVLVQFLVPFYCLSLNVLHLVLVLALFIIGIVFKWFMVCRRSAPVPAPGLLRALFSWARPTASSRLGAWLGSSISKVIKPY